MSQNQTPTGFTIHSRDSAPAAAQDTLAEVAKIYGGGVPNFFGVAANSPAAAKAYLTLNKLFSQETALSAAEQQAVLLTISALNKCNYCVAAHTASAEGAGLDQATIQALRAGQPTGDGRLDAVQKLVQRLHATEGWLTEGDVKAFIDAGFDQQRLMDVILGYATKTLSNYINHVAQTPVDPPMADKALDAAE